MNTTKYKSYALVTMQFGLLGALIIYAGISGNIASIALAILALALGVWAILSMKLKVNILPDVREGQKLIIVGPYKYIRHPMYTAVLLLGLASVINKANTITILLLIALFAVLNVKLTYEESMLTTKFTEYKSYKIRTKRLVPYIF